MASLALLARLEARDAVLAATNRKAMSRAHWIAAGCLEQARGAIEARLEEVGRRPYAEQAAASVWIAADSLAGRALSDACALSLRAVGARVNVNIATHDELASALRYADLDSASADSIADAIIDWVDVDDEVSREGAEREWYALHDRPGPRNAPIAQLSELTLVRGLEPGSAYEGNTRDLLDIEMGRTSLALAPAPVLAALPGMTPGALSTIEARRSAGVRVDDVLNVAGELPTAEREALAASAAQRLGRTVWEPDAWIARVTASGIESGADPQSAPSVTLEARFARSADRVVMMRRREAR